MAIEKAPATFIFQENNTAAIGATNPVVSKPLNEPVVSSASEGGIAPFALYEYSLGLQDIQAKFITYGDRQAVVTKPMVIPGNVMEVELEATEEHPVFDEANGKATNRQTSVEYYISYKNKPGLEDWIPILPKNQALVEGERLFFQGNEATLRFPARLDENTFRLYANGLRLPYTDILLYSNQRIGVKNFNTGTIYTVDYVPDSYAKDPWVCKLNDYKKDVQTITERFTDGTTFNKTITLEYYPYIDLQRILEEPAYNPNTSAYKPIQVRLVDADIQGRNRKTLKLVDAYREELLAAAYTYNKTLYRDKSWSELRAYDLNESSYYGGFDYYHWQNKLTFTEQFNVARLQENLAYTHGNATIEVTYQTLVTQFRLKVIVRRNSAQEQTATPKVADYRLRFKTMK